MKFRIVRLIVWLLTSAIFPLPADLIGWSFQVEVLQHLSANRGACSESEPCRVDATERVLLYLESAEKKEIDPWLRDDIRIAWITAKWSRDGVPEWSLHRGSAPHIAATWQVLHCHPDQVWPRIVAARKAKLGALYTQVWGGASSPRKPVQSVWSLPASRRAA